MNRPDADQGYENRSCPVCGGVGQAYLQKNEYEIDRCASCGFVYVRNVPSVDFLKAYYGKWFRMRGEEKIEQRVPNGSLGKQLTNWWLAKRIRFLCKDGGRALEIGYGPGNLLQALRRERVFKVEGIDFSTNTFQQLKSLGYNVSISSLEDKKYPVGRFDLVIGMHVLEHVQQPSRFISEVHRILGHSGRIYFQVPCVSYWRTRLAGKNWKHFTPPGHLWYFSPRTMRLFLSKHGFRVLSAHSLSHRAHLTVTAEKITAPSASARDRAAGRI